MFMRLREDSKSEINISYIAYGGRLSNYGHLIENAGHTFPGSLKEEPDHQNLQDGHAYHHNDFNQAEIEDSLFCTSDSAEIAVFSCPEILLHPTDGT